MASGRDGTSPHGCWKEIVKSFQLGHARDTVNIPTAMIYSFWVPRVKTPQDVDGRLFLKMIVGVNPHLRINGPMNINHYATKKSVAESMLDVALFMANVTQLKAVLEQGPSFQYYATLIVLISISLFFQVMIGILLIITARLNLNDIAKQPRLNVLNNAATALIFITVILNIFITAFGVQKTGLYPTRNFGPY